MKTLGELCDIGGIQTGPFGSQLHAHEYTIEGVPVVMPQDIGDNAIDEARIARVPDKVADRLPRHRLRAGDIVYSRRGDVERRAWIRSQQAGWLCGTGCLRVRTDPELADSRYVSYCLGTSETRAWITSHAVGGTMLNLNTTILSSVPLEIPDLHTQRAIAEVLGALDDKIAANEILITAADRLRRTHYEVMLTDDTAPLSELARFVNGRAFTKGATGTGRVVVRIAELNSGLGGSTVYNDLEVPDDNLVRPGDLLFAWSGSLTAARWYRPEAIVNQHIFKVIPDMGWPIWVVATAVHRKLDDFKGIAADKATTMGHIQRHHLDQLVLVPSKAQVAKNDSGMVALWDRALAAEVESLRLVTLRDTLLPYLMSGRITVREAEERVEASL